MLSSQVVVNLLLKLCDGVDRVPDYHCFERSLARGEHNLLDKRRRGFVHLRFCSVSERVVYHGGLDRGSYPPVSRLRFHGRGRARYQKVEGIRAGLGFVEC
jgi:hypothetical protein